VFFGFWLVAGHVWFDALRCFRKINIVYGDIITFSARVEPYSKQNTFDYKFARPKDVYLTVE
jgi:hypothetical protein